MSNYTDWELWKKHEHTWSAIQHVLTKIYENKDVTIADLVYSENWSDIQDRVPRAVSILKSEKLVEFDEQRVPFTKISLTFRGLWIAYTKQIKLINYSKFI